MKPSGAAASARTVTVEPDATLDPEGGLTNRTAGGVPTGLTILIRRVAVPLGEIWLPLLSKPRASTTWEEGVAAGV